MRVVRGNPSDEELAALVAVLSAVAASREAGPEVELPRPRRPVRYVPATSWRLAR
ncbi:acyl-CoA carboxylase subunit epsilon [Amycolatopsis sp. NPDC051903]|uniref:acyl-CoA carboxylase subunit epsilon n=1 Tax=Amycolatopsis sp. NPDC051903 TaxID=3363936 RepID=UPI0037A2AB94